jgi:hypothetical protein
MSAYFKVSEIGFFSLEQWPVTVCAWRGCCIELFARAEHSVADCLRVLEKAGLTLGKEAHSPFASNRLKGLSVCIARHAFGGHGNVAQKRIATWEQVYETRACLAHGKIKATANGITIQHIAFDGKVEKVAPPRHFSRIGMLEILDEIEQSQLMLHQQLGHIKALAAQAKPIPTP